MLAARNPPSELARRVRFLRKGFALEPARRRLAGSSAAFDRPLFVFLEAARRSLPPSARGVVLSLPSPSEPAIHLAAYTFAPRPVLIAPAALPPGFVTAVYGPVPAGVRILRSLPGGALVVPGAP